MYIIGVIIGISLVVNLFLFYFFFLLRKLHLDGDDGGHVPVPLTAAVSDHLVLVLFQPERQGQQTFVTVNHYCNSLLCQ